MSVPSLAKLAGVPPPIFSVALSHIFRRLGEALASEERVLIDFGIGSLVGDKAHVNFLFHEVSEEKKVFLTSNRMNAHTNTTHVRISLIGYENNMSSRNACNKLVSTACTSFCLLYITKLMYTPVCRRSALLIRSLEAPKVYPSTRQRTVCARNTNWSLESTLPCPPPVFCGPVSKQKFVCRFAIDILSKHPHARDAD